jgi:hypothetical protein
MDYGAAFGYVFKDKNWAYKVFIGGLFFILSIVVIGGIIVTGYMIRVIRNVIEGKDTPLPEWSGIGEFLSEGIKPFLIVFVYNLPVLVLAILRMVIMFGFRDLQAVAALTAVLQLLLQLAFVVWTPTVIIRYTVHGTFRSGFEFAELFEFIRLNLGDYLVAVLMIFVAGMIASVGIFACCVGYFFTVFWAVLVTAHLYGQLYRVHLQKTGQAS